MTSHLVSYVSFPLWGARAERGEGEREGRGGCEGLQEKDFGQVTSRLAATTTRRITAHGSPHLLKDDYSSHLTHS